VLAVVVLRPVPQPESEDGPAEIAAAEYEHSGV
jgi:hypothetical protein